MSWEDWIWDESLFAGAAPYYERGRLPYSDALADVFEHALGLDGSGRLLDVGCGPGTVARRLAHLFETVVGLDPDAEWAPPFPDTAVEELRARWLGKDRRAGQAVRNTSPSGEPEVFAAAGFAAPEVVTVPDGRLLERTIDDLVAERFASSGSAPHLFGDRVTAFERELREVLAAATSSGRFTVRLPDNLLFVYRPIT